MRDNSILTAGFYLIILIGIGKLIAFAKDIVISSYYGANFQTDAFFVANNIPSLIFIAFYSTISMVFLPLYNEKTKQKGSIEASLFASNVINFYVIVSIILTLLGVIFSSFLVSIVAPSFNEKTAGLASELTKILCLSFAFSTIAGILSTIQYVHKRYANPQLIPIINNGILVISIIIFSKLYGIYVVAFASVLGWVLQLPIQTLLTGRHFKYSPILNLKDESLKRMGILIIPAFIGISIDQIYILVDNILGSALDEGSLSSLNYAIRLINFFSGLFIVVISSILYPVFSDHILNKDGYALNSAINQSIRAFILIATPVTIISFFYNYEIVSLVFKRGAFTENAAIQTSSVFFFYTIGISFILIREILNKVFYAYQDMKTPLYISIGSIIINVILSLILVRAMGVSGLALGTSVSIIFYVTIQFFLIRKKIGNAFYNKIGKFLFSIVVSLAVMSIGLYFFRQYIKFDALLIELVVGTIIGGILYFVLLFLLKVQEIALLLNYFKTFLTKLGFK